MPSRWVAGLVVIVGVGAGAATGGCKARKPVGTEVAHDAAPAALPGTRTPRVDQLVAGFSSADFDAWLAGSQALRKARQSLDRDEVIALLRAAAALAPLDDAHDPQAAILSGLEKVASDAAYAPVIEALLPRLRPAAQASALRMRLAAPDGVDRLIALAPSYPAAASVAVEELQSPDLVTDPAQRRAVLALVSSPVLAERVALLALTWIGDKRMVAADLAPVASPLVRASAAARARLDAARGGAAAGATSEQAMDDAAVAVGIYLDLMQHLPVALAAPELAAGVRDPDAAIAVFAVMSMWRTGRAPPQDAVERVVASDRARWILRTALPDDLWRANVPAPWRTQEALARADLAHWLSAPSELGRWPDEMQRMGVVPVDAGPDGKLDVYVFRFRMKAPDRLASSGWMAGIAGPYRRGDEPSVGAPGTFSRLDPAASRTPAGHVGAIADILEDWRATVR